MKLRLFLPFFACLGLVACASGPDYQRPQMDLPAHWQARAQGGAASGQVHNWWQQFNDPVLQTLQQQAEQNSNTLAQDLASIRSARASRQSAQSGLWPSLTLSAQNSSSKGSTSSSTGSDNVLTRSNSGTLDASWELDLFGKTSRSVESAAALLRARQADWHDARVSLAAEVATDYVDYRVCQLKESYYQRQADSQDKTTALTWVSARAGLTAQADAQLADASAASTRATALAQHTECEVLIKTMVALTGMQEPALRTTLAQGDAVLPQPQALVVDSVPADLLRQRPDVVAAEQSLMSTSALIGSAEAKRWPSITLSGSVALSRTVGSTVSTPWSFGPSLSLPLFDGGSISASIESAKADYDKAIANYRQVVTDAVKEVEQALVRLDNMAAREAALRRSADGYRAYLDAQLSYQKVGGSSQLDIESARRSSISADVSLLELQQSRLEYWIALYKAVGGGWLAPQGEQK